MTKRMKGWRLTRASCISGSLRRGLGTARAFSRITKHCMSECSTKGGSGQQAKILGNRHPFGAPKKDLRSVTRQSVYLLTV